MRFDIEMDVVRRYFMSYLPIIFYQLIPIASMMATLFTLSTLSKNNELTALFSLGVSLFRISIPILSLVMVISITAFWLGDRIVPIFAQKKNYTYYVEMRKKPGLYSTVKKNKIWYRSDNVIFNIQSLNSERASAQGLTLYYLSENWDLVQMIRAREVSMRNQEWDLVDGTVTLFLEESSFPMTKPFDKKTITMSEDLADIGSAAPSSDAMSLKDLEHFIIKNKEAGLDTLALQVDMHARMSYAFAGLVLSLLSVPFTVQKSRSGGNLANVGVSLGIAVGYWIVMSTFLSLGKHGILPPVLAAWAPNICLAGVAIYFLRRLRK